MSTEENQNIETGHAMSNNGPMGDFLFELSRRMNEAAELIYQPTCPECGHKITGESYNGRCWSCWGQMERQDAAISKDQGLDP